MKLLIGIGNPNFSDDGLGFWTVEALCGEIQAVHFLSPSLYMVKTLLGKEKVVIVDAVKLGLKPGEIVELDLTSGQNQKLYGGNSHSVSLSEIITVGYSLFADKMPREIKFIGVEAADLETFKNELTEPVKKAFPKVVEKVKNILFPK
ncbi:hydrogenase maturation protease [Desulfurobacterium thermolithotrophum DSM 11699]|uniref:Hydrogenase maturation protease n=1 Tax=Desulfurobacterium thermolithotrophum (strain DSM 11699 / BSA) TaxID=868864 RepID=F0S2F7_DESTD|nr:hydrogenase maturation protease [Desulfurobacterium thermolithotrophum]ADY73029.1 hydrogenase maturation protease [Desulfurobacterium thermolithotrophum DSM 11699]